MKKSILIILTICMSAGALLNAAEIHDATVSGDRATVEAILAADPDAIETEDHNGLTPLYVALDRGRNSMAKFLIEKGANVNVRGYRNRTLLHAATRVGNVDVAQTLLRAGADVDARDHDGKTPLQLTQRASLPEMVKLLASHGAGVNVRDEYGTSPLTHVVNMREADAVQTLLDYGADPNMADEFWGRTPLHWAALKGNHEAARLLMDGGAQINALNSNGHSPLDLAVRHAHQKTAEVLQARGGTRSMTASTYDPASALAADLSEGDAYVWYLGHCGFAIKTANHFLIFDYFHDPHEPEHRSLANGCINTDEIKEQKVYVFVTHAHHDHFDPAIFDWAGELDDATYIYGFDANSESPNRRTGPVGTGYNGPNFEMIGPRQQRVIGNLQITTIESVDAGVGFLVKVDGLEIYHAGDHAGWRTNDKDKFTREIDYLARHSEELDFAFVNATGCHTHCDVALASSAHYTLQKLAPVLWFPTHAVDQEYKYREFAQKVGQENYSSTVVCGEARGDCFLYRDGRLQESSVGAP